MWNVFKTVKDYFAQGPSTLIMTSDIAKFVELTLNKNATPEGRDIIREEIENNPAVISGDYV